MNINKKPSFQSPELTVEDLSLALFKANKKLEEANKLLSEKNQALILSQKEKNELFNNISHDLRSPVTAIHNSIEYLLSLSDFKKEDAFPYLSLINRRIDLLENLIEDVFLLSSLNSSSKKMNLQTINLGMFLEDFFFSCEVDTKYENRKLILEIPEFFPYNVFVDGKLLTRVMDNLFTNALKYSNISSSITLTASLNTAETLLVCVKDTGIGIPQDSINKIFDRSYMVAEARTPDNSSGCGLGLAIAKSIIERLNGTISCESIVGEGSSFFFTLPLKNN